ncbi:MAG: hypothetical protein Q9227_006611 [Pyrenula ochraceoflavens]
MRYTSTLALALLTLVPGLQASPRRPEAADTTKSSGKATPTGVSAKGTSTGISGAFTHHHHEPKCHPFADAWKGQNELMSKICKGGKTTEVQFWLTDELVYKTDGLEKATNNVYRPTAGNLENEQHSKRARETGGGKNAPSGGPRTSDSPNPHMTTVPVGQPATVIVCQKCPDMPSSTGKFPFTKINNNGPQPTGEQQGGKTSSAKDNDKDPRPTGGQNGRKSNNNRFAMP